jgi:hypothetical protein
MYVQKGCEDEDPSEVNRSKTLRKFLHLISLIRILIISSQTETVCVRNSVYEYISLCQFNFSCLASLFTL